MRRRLHTAVLSALLAPVMLLAVVTQGLTLVRCGSTVRIASCCCPDEASAGHLPAMVEAGSGCDHFAVPAAAPRLEQRTLHLSAPVAVAIVNLPASVLAVVSASLPPPQPDARPWRSVVLANRALLI